MPDREATPRADALIGTEIGSGIRVERQLARGALFTVYAGRRTKRGPVAVKIFHAELERALPSEMPRLVDDTARHARIPKLESELTVQGRRALVYPLVDGESALSLITRRPGRIPPAEALRIAGEVLEALVPLHAARTPHGMITPSHAVLDEHGAVHLIGFGEARLRSLLGVPLDKSFIGPEHVNDTSPSISSDLWSVGALLFALLTGCNAYGVELGQTPKRLMPAPLQKLARHAPQVLADLVDRALGPDTPARLPSAGALLAAIQDLSQLREVHYCHALGSALAPSSASQPLLDAARAALVTTQPPLSPRTARAVTTAPGTPQAKSEPPARRKSAAPPPSRLPPVAGPASEPPMTPVSPVSAQAVVMKRSETPAGLGPPFTESRDSSPPAAAAPVAARPFVAPPVQAVMRAATQPAFPAHESSPPSLRRRREADLAVGLVSEEESESEALTSVVNALSEAVETRDAATLDSFFAVAQAALAGAKSGLACRVMQETLESARGPVWRAPGPLASIVAALHGAGISALAFLPGVTRAELETLVDVLSKLDANVDALTLLGDADFEHLLFHTPDPLPIGEDRDLRRERERLLSLLAFDSGFQLEDAWAAARLGGASVPGGVAARLKAFASEPPLLSIESWEAAWEHDGEPDSLRLARVAASTLDGPAFEPGLRAFGPRLKEHLTSLGSERPSDALEAILQLVQSTRAPKNVLSERQREVVAAVASPELVAELVVRLGAEGTTEDAVTALRELFPLLGSEHAAGVATALSAVSDLKLRAEADHFLEYGASGHEPALGEQAATAEPKVALGLVRLLARIDTLAAKSALDRAAANPSPVVRIEALGLRDGPSSDALRLELRARLEEAPGVERIRTLRALSDLEIRVAAPFIALRMRSAELDELPHEERRQLFQALSVLAPARAEAIAIELLGKEKLLSGEAHEETRALAADALGRVGNSEQALEILAEHATRRWKGSEHVREAAQRALEAVGRRLEGSHPASVPPPGPKGGRER